MKASRKSPPKRRSNETRSFRCDDHNYNATAGFYPNGALAEIFLDCGKVGTPLQVTAENAAILVSLLLQHSVNPETILHSVTGPIAIALGLFIGKAVAS